MYRTISVFLIYIFLPACSILQNTPETSQKPEHKVAIRGEKPADLNLRISLGYATTHDACNKKNYIEGADIPRQIKDTLFIPAGRNKFNIEFYLDKYIPGKCEWLAKSFYYSVDNSTDTDFHGSWYLLGQIDKNKNQQTIAYHFLCKRMNHKIFCRNKDNPKFRKPVPGIPSSGGEILLKFENI